LALPNTWLRRNLKSKFELKGQEGAMLVELGELSRTYLKIRSISESFPMASPSNQALPLGAAGLSQGFCC
jgi:hypothetical protein